MRQNSRSLAGLTVGARRARPNAGPAGAGPASPGKTVLSGTGRGRQVVHDQARAGAGRSFVAGRALDVVALPCRRGDGRDTVRRGCA